MTTWKVKPLFKKSIVEENYYEKSGKFIIEELGWRWGELIVKTKNDNIPTVNENTDFFAADFELLDFSMEDSCWDDLEFEGDWSVEEQEKIENSIMTGKITVHDLQEKGWVCVKSKLFILCDVEITPFQYDEGFY